MTSSSDATGDNGLAEQLKALLREFDDSTSPTSEDAVHSRIEKLAKAGKAGELPAELIAECLAFEFRENCQDEDNSWGTYFGPFAVLRNQDGTLVEVPSIASVDERMLEYWARRAEESKNPLLKARYFGLVWDLAKKITGESPDHRIAREYIANLLLIVKCNLHDHRHDMLQKLRRALSLSLSLNDKALASDCKDMALEYVQAISADGDTWGYSFLYDLLIETKTPVLSETEEKEIIDQLEVLFERLSTIGDDGGVDPWSCDEVADRLAGYYNVRGRKDEVARILGTLRAVWEHMAARIAPMVAYAWLEDLHSKLMRFDQRTEAEAVRRKMRELGPAINEDMKEVSVPIEIPRKEFDEYLEAMTDGGVEKVIARIAVQYIPRRDDTLEQLTKLSQEAPLQYRIGKSITNDRGMVTACVGPLDDDIEGNLVSHISQNIGFAAPFLNAVLLRLTERYQLTADMLIEEIMRTPLFLEDKAGLLKMGLECLLRGEHVSAAHILIPRIEDAIRGLVIIEGGTDVVPGKNGGFDVKTFGRLLGDPIVEAALGDNMVLYLKVLLTDRRGWNLRNNVCHGLLPAEAFNPMMTDRILHVILCLSLLRVKEEPDQADA